MSFGDFPIEIIYEIARKDVKVYKKLYLMKNKKIHRALTTEYLFLKDIFIKDNEYFFLNIKHNFKKPNVIKYKKFHFITKREQTYEWYYFGDLRKSISSDKNGKLLVYYYEGKKHRLNEPAYYLFDTKGNILMYEYYYHGICDGIRHFDRNDNKIISSTFCTRSYHEEINIFFGFFPMMNYIDYKSWWKTKTIKDNKNYDRKYKDYKYFKDNKYFKNIIKYK